MPNMVQPSLQALCTILFQMYAHHAPCFVFMKVSWYGNAFRITGHLWVESTGHRLTPHTGPMKINFDVFFVVNLINVLTRNRVVTDLRQHDFMWRHSKMLCTGSCQFYLYPPGLLHRLEHSHDCSCASERTLKSMYELITPSSSTTT